MWIVFWVILGILAAVLIYVWCRAASFYSQIKKLKKVIYHLTGENEDNDKSDTASGDASGGG